jgi:hypothetical protein
MSLPCCTTAAPSRLANWIRALARFRREEYAKLIWPAARYGAVGQVQHKLFRWCQQVG